MTANSWTPRQVIDGHRWSATAVLYRREDPPATKVDYGAGYLFTHESLADLMARIGTADRFVRLTTRGGAPVYLNAAAITSVRQALPMNGPGTEIVVAGQYQHVMESVAEVQRLIA